MVFKYTGNFNLFYNTYQGIILKGITRSSNVQKKLKSLNLQMAVANWSSQALSVLLANV